MPKLPGIPGIPGIAAFQGHSFLTSRWDYAYTGGDPTGAALDGLADKRVAVIGTGAKAVQCGPHLARACAELHVFQRTRHRSTYATTRRSTPTGSRRS